MQTIVMMQYHIVKNCQSDLLKRIYQSVPRCLQLSSLVSFAVHLILFLLSNKVAGSFQGNMSNKQFYRHCRYLKLNIHGFDLSTSRLWYAMLMTMRGDYPLSLQVLNNVLSSIPPFALYCSPINLPHVSNETKKMVCRCILQRQHSCNRASTDSLDA